MIIFRCDLCHEEKQTKFLRIQDYPLVVVWDICKDCFPRLQEILGAGREIKLGKR